MSSRIAVVVLASFTIAAPAFAGDATCESVEIKATADGDIDPSLAKLRSKLEEPPFNGWKGFKPLSRATPELTKQKSQAIALKIGTASVLLRDRDAKQIALTIQIDGADGTRRIETKPSIAVGNWLLLVDASSKKEGHIFGLTCK